MMDNDKHITTTTRDGIGELVNTVDNHTNSNSTRTYSPPLMGTSARAAKRRIDNDTNSPIHIEGTDTYNQQLQHHYQNIRPILDNQQSNIDQSDEPRQSFSAKREFFEQQLKSPSSTYDSPPREQQQPTAQKIITTITTTTSKIPIKRSQSKSLEKQSSLSSSPVDRLLEEATELQKLKATNSLNTNDSQKPLVIERTEQYQVFLDPKTHEIRRTPTIPVGKTGHSTDIDEAQTHTDRFLDDHQAIQQLTRVLQEHNTTTINEYKRLPSTPQTTTTTNPILINTTTTTTTTIPSNIDLTDRTNQPINSEFTVIDAILDNPLGTNNNKQNRSLHTRFNNILTNLRNAEYVNALKQSTSKITKKKQTKKSKNNTTKISLVDKQTQITESMIDPTLTSSEDTILLSSKDKKKRKKFKSKKISTDTNYQVIDAIISSPISFRLPDSYLTKYKVNPPLSQLSVTSPITGKDSNNNNNNLLLLRQLDTKAKNETVYDLVKIVNELMLHNAAALTASGSQTKNNLYQSVRSSNSNQLSEPIKPRIVYRYMDEQGNILKISSISPSELREMTPGESKTNTYKPTEPVYVHNRPITIDNERRHYLPEREQRTTWHDEPKLPTKVTREDFELRDKRRPKLSEQQTSITRTIPISIERQYSKKTPLYQQPSSHHPDQENVRLTWLPLSYQLDQPYIPSGTTGYESDSTESEKSIPYRSHDYPSTDNRPLLQNTYYSNHSPIRPYYPSPTRLPSSNQGVSLNYIEVFRDGEIKPSEIYSLPFNETVSSNQHHSRFDQYESDKFNKKHVLSSSPTTKYAKVIPSLSNPQTYSDHTIQHSPNRDQPYLDNYIQQSKSFDYRPLRTKLQREYKITPSLLVDEWDQPTNNIQSTSTDYNLHTSISSPDDVFINNNNKHRTNKA